jgi:hypothetical protein
MFVVKARRLPYSGAPERCVGSDLTCRHYPKLGKLARDKHSSVWFVNYGQKGFIALSAGQLFTCWVGPTSLNHAFSTFSFSLKDFILRLKIEVNFVKIIMKIHPGKSYWRGRLSTVDLLVLISWDQLLFYFEYNVYFFYKTIYQNKEVNCTEPFPLIRIPWYTPPHPTWRPTKSHFFFQKLAIPIMLNYTNSW